MAAGRLYYSYLALTRTEFFSKHGWLLMVSSLSKIWYHFKMLKTKNEEDEINALSICPRQLTDFFKPHPIRRYYAALWRSTFTHFICDWIARPFQGHLISWTRFHGPIQRIEKCQSNTTHIRKEKAENEQRRIQQKLTGTGPLLLVPDDVVGEEEWLMGHHCFWWMEICTESGFLLRFWIKYDIKWYCKMFLTECLIVVRTERKLVFWKNGYPSSS